MKKIIALVIVCFASTLFAGENSPIVATSGGACVDMTKPGKVAIKMVDIYADPLTLTGIYSKSPIQEVEQNKVLDLTSGIGFSCHRRFKGECNDSICPLPVPELVPMVCNLTFDHPLSNSEVVTSIVKNKKELEISINLGPQNTAEMTKFFQSEASIESDIDFHFISENSNSSKIEMVIPKDIINHTFWYCQYN